MNQYTPEFEQKILARLTQFGIPELTTVRKLNKLPSDYINLECTLPDGRKGKILDDRKNYLAAQVRISGNERCYGIAADEKQIAVFQYGCNGTDAVLILWRGFITVPGK